MRPAFENRVKGLGRAVLKTFRDDLFDKFSNDNELNSMEEIDGFRSIWQGN
jgi:hypothetical protein